VRIGLLQLNATIGDYGSNVGRLLAGYREVVAKGAELAVAPEMFLCGYPPRDLLLRADFIESGISALDRVAAEVGKVPLLVGCVGRSEMRPGKALVNQAALVQNGSVQAFIAKTLLPTYDVFDEDRYFEPAAIGQLSPIEIAGIPVGVTICEDIWNDEDHWPERRYRRDPVRELLDRGARLIVNLSASPWHQGKERTRLEMLRRVAHDDQVPLVMVNLAGGNDELVFDGHSVALAAGGGLLAFEDGSRMGAGFKEHVAVVDTERAPSSADPFTGPQDLAQRAGATGAPSQLHAALCLGIRDYVRKCGFRDVIVGLSGGIDSAVVATLAAHALGPEHVLGVSMPSKFSSPGSLTDAQALALSLGIRYQVIPIVGAVEELETVLTPSFAGRPSGLTEENLQSRLRGVILMALSNKLSALVLTTGNKSEMAVGYCTLYGDMCGALAVIADVLKTEVYDLAHWINGQNQVIPEASITKPPSAELRPGQRDEDSLPPYPVLDRILRRYIVDESSPSELIASGEDPMTVHDVLHKVIISEYKRRQAAPGLKVSPRAFGMGRRIPVAQRFHSARK
jgi:NAD+ synthetase